MDASWVSLKCNLDKSCHCLRIDRAWYFNRNTVRQFDVGAALRLVWPHRDRHKRIAAPRCSCRRQHTQLLQSTLPEIEILQIEAVDLCISLHRFARSRARFEVLKPKGLRSREIFPIHLQTIARLDPGKQKGFVDRLRGHDYITLVVDIDGRRVTFVGDGRSADAVARFADHLEDHGGDASRIKQASIDMSPAFIKGVSENLTEAEITFDRFHVMKLIGDAIDEVRRAEVKTRPELKGTRYAWTKNDANLTARQSAQLANLAATNLKTARAWRMRLAFQEIYAQPSRGWAELFFVKWIGWAKRSRLEPMKAVARTMEKHRDGILAWFDSGISNGLIEGINSLVQAAKTKARGYRNRATLKAMTYLIAGKLDLKLPT